MALAAVNCRLTGMQVAGHHLLHFSHQIHQRAVKTQLIFTSVTHNIRTAGTALFDVQDYRQDLFDCAVRTVMFIRVQNNSDTLSQDWAGTVENNTLSASACKTVVSNM